MIRQADRGGRGARGGARRMPDRRWLASLAMPWLCTACLHLRPASPSAGPDGDRILITEEKITHSGALNAWEVLKRLAPQFRYSERRGQPTNLERRGRSSILLSDAPRVFLDGADVVDFRSLTQIPASTIFSIEILSGIEGTTYYGSNAVSGGNLVRTQNGSLWPAHGPQSHRAGSFPPPRHRRPPGNPR